jgi:hypothetical protein
MYRSLLMPSLLAAAVLLTGCGSEDGTEISLPDSDRPAASAEPTEPIEQPTSTPVEPTVDGTADEGAADEVTTEQATTDEGTVDESTSSQGSSDDAS